MNPWTIIGWIILAIPVLLVLLALVFFGGVWLEGIWLRHQSRRWWRKTRQAPLPEPGKEAVWKQYAGKLSLTVRAYDNGAYSGKWQNGTIWGGAEPADIRQWIDRYQLYCPDHLQ